MGNFVFGFDPLNFFVVSQILSSGKSPRNFKTSVKCKNTDRKNTASQADFSQKNEHFFSIEIS